MRPGMSRLVRTVLTTATTAFLLVGVARQATAAPDTPAIEAGVPSIAVSGQPFPVAFVNSEGGPLPAGILYVSTDVRPAFVSVPLKEGQAYWTVPALVAQVPASLVAGQTLRYYAVFRDRATGRAVTVPPGGAANPGTVHVVTAPIEVRLGRHEFGKLTAPDTVVARVGADGVGWEEPHGDGLRLGPSSFEIGADGSVWLLDALNRRLLGWPRGKPDHPIRVVTLPVYPADFAVGPNGTFYISANGTPEENTMVAYSVTADGQARWRAPLATDLFNGQLRMGPGGVLFDVTDEGWIPVTTTSGNPLTPAEQRRLTQKHLPLPDGGHLVVTAASRRDIRVAVIDAVNHPVRAWRITSATDIAPPGAALPALAGGNPVVPLDVFDQPEGEGPGRLEQIALQLTAAGAPSPPHVDNAIWGDTPTTEYRVGPDGAFYQLRTSRTTGVTIVRYTFDAAAPAPTPTGGAAAPTPAATTTGGVEVPASVATSAATPAVERPTTDATSWGWLAWTGGAVLAVLAILGGAFQVWHRRRRPEPPLAADGPADVNDAADLAQPTIGAPG